MPRARPDPLIRSPSSRLADGRITSQLQRIAQGARPGPVRDARAAARGLLRDDAVVAAAAAIPLRVVHRGVAHALEVVLGAVALGFHLRLGEADVAGIGA